MEHFSMILSIYSANNVLILDNVGNAVEEMFAKHVMMKITQEIMCWKHVNVIQAHIKIVLCQMNLTQMI